MKEHWWKFLFGGAGAAILFAATSWLVAQEVHEQVEPIEAEYQQFSATVSQMQFEGRNAEVMAEHNVCVFQGHTPEACDVLAKWRWDVWYPYLECARRVERYDEREAACGPVPEPPLIIEPED